MIIAMQVKTIENHPNADSLKIYRMVAPGFEETQIIANLENIYAPEDIVACALAGTILKDGTEIKKSKIRGTLSFGMALGKTDAKLGENITSQFEATDKEKKNSTGMEELVEESLWPKYTNIVGYLKIKDEILNVPEVIVTEKADGSNIRFGYDNRGYLIGTHTSRILNDNPSDWSKGHLIEKALTWAKNVDIKNRIMLWKSKHLTCTSLAVYGEVCGFKCSSLHYGMKDSTVRLFGEINFNGNFLNYDCAIDVLKELFDKDIYYVPFLYRGKPDHKLFKFLRDQPSKLAKINNTDQISEGIVIRPTTEVFSETTKDRLIAKYKSPLYEERGSLSKADPDSLPKYISAYDLILDFITEERIKHVFQKAESSGIEISFKNKKQLTSMLLDDIVKESQGEWPESLENNILLAITNGASGEIMTKTLRNLIKVNEF